MSGRALRRLPVLALARYIGVGSFASLISASSASVPVSASNTPSSRPTKGSRKDSDVNGVKASPAFRMGSGSGADVEVWLDGMEKVIIEQAKELERFSG